MYGGYVYARSQEEARGIKVFLLEQLPVVFNIEPFNKIPVSIKRGCTEYEMELGDSGAWRVSKEQKKFEEEIERQAEKPSIPIQTEEEKKTIMAFWVRTACGFGDMEYLKHTSVPLHVECREYM
jgi:hypothetical protein